MSQPLPFSAPESVLFVRPDTLGDVVLFSAALRALRTYWPDTRMGLVARSAYIDLIPALTPGVDLLATGIDTYHTSPANAAREAADLAARARAWKPEWLVAACPQRNWLDFHLAASVRASRNVAFAGTSPDPFFGAQLVRMMPDATATVFTEKAPDLADAPDWLRGLALADFLSGGELPKTPPHLQLPTEWLTSGQAVLDSLGLSPGGYAACAAAGFANVQIKTWAPERFAGVIKWLNNTQGLPTLLLGQNEERVHLESIAARTPGGSVRIWTGGPGDLRLLAALLACSRLFVGNDTGAMHLAAAADRPVAAVFGGGTWPRFLPAGRRSLAVAQLLPCYGCGWDCPWGDAPCVKAVSTEAFIRPLERLLGAGEADHREVVNVDAVPPDTATLLGNGARCARVKTADHLSRLLKIEEIAAQAAEKDIEISSLKAAADEKQNEIVALKAETNGKDLEIGMLKKDAEEKASELRRKDAEIRSLKEETDRKDAEIRSLKETSEIRLIDARGKQGEIDQLKRACDERLALIQRLNESNRFLNEEREALLAGIEASRNAESAARDRAAATEALYTGLAPDASKWAGQLQEAQARAAALQNDLNSRLAELAAMQAQLAEKDRSLQNYFNQHGALEVNKHYQRLLREKEDVLQVLHRACREREAVIHRLVAEATAATSGLRRLAIGLAAGWEARFSEPWREWTRKKILDGYWMQLGSLYQYEARAIAWDRSVSRARCAPGRAPRIGLVTPSFNQAVFLERTMRSVLDQKYPDLQYVIQDGGSRDGSPAIIRAASARLFAWESAPDKGQADAIRRGFGKLSGQLGAEDIMAWLNSDDLLAPGALHWVGSYFAAHPEVDVIYGHRIIVDEEDREVARWVLPPHDPETLRWIDFIPQETMFWRVRAWDRVGGLDPSFHFALDWDLALRFQEAGLRIARVPRFLGVFRVHAAQKTSAQIHTRGNEEMERVRQRLHGPKPDHTRLDHETRKAQLAGAFYSRLLDRGLRL